MSPVLFNFRIFLPLKVVSSTVLVQKEIWKELGNNVRMSEKEVIHVIKEQFYMRANWIRKSVPSEEILTLSSTMHTNWIKVWQQSVGWFFRNKDRSGRAGDQESRLHIFNGSFPPHYNFLILLQPLSVFDQKRKSDERTNLIEWKSNESPRIYF